MSWRTLTVKDVAEIAKVSPRTVRVHLASKRLRGKKQGRDWVISERDVVRWLDTYTPYDTLRRRGVFR